MKGKGYVIGLLVLVAVFVIGGVTFMYQQTKKPMIAQDINEIVQTSTVIESQPYYAKFASTIEKQSLKNGAIALQDENGNPVDASMQIIENRLLAIPDLVEGTYQLTVMADALEEPMKATQTIDFTVYEQVEKVTSAQDLQRYFLAIEQSNEAQNLQDYIVRDGFWNLGTVEEESMKGDQAASTESGDYSTTNNQEEGIEEGDVSITDGAHIYSIRDNDILITKTDPLASASKISMGDEYPMQLMKQGDYLIVFSEGYEERQGMSMALFKTSIYDVSNAKKPKLVREFAQEGHQVGVRLMDETLYVATEKYETFAYSKETELRPAIQDSVEDIGFVRYEDIQIFPQTQSDVFTVLSAIQLDQPEKNELKTQAFLGNAGQLYMSNQAIYLASGQYEMMPAAQNRSDIAVDIANPWWQSTMTKVYKYAVKGTDIARVGEAVVDGQLLNQYAMDEQDGFLRIATTSGRASLRDADANNHLTILNSEMKEVGKLTNLARGEQIYAVRYMGDKAYIVTFKETDPLFVIDVADPKNPNVLGELKIPGFSNYLHPLNETHLIGIGYDTEVVSKDNVVYTKGMKVSLFDVSDVHNPKEVAYDIIGGRGTYSDVNHNPKALYRDVQNGYYGFPISVYDDHIYKGAGAVIYEITEQGVNLKGDFVKKQQGAQYEEWEDIVLRIIYSGDQMYMIYNNKIAAYDRQSLQPIQEMKLP